MSLRKMLIVGALSLAIGSAAKEGSCDVREGSCDETSLIQVQQTVEHASQRSVQQHEQPAGAPADQSFNLTAVKAKANKEVADANLGVWKAASDEKVAKELDYVEKFATEVAKWKQQKAQNADDTAKAATYAADRHNNKAQWDAMEKEQWAKEQAARKAAAAVAYAQAKKLADAAEAASLARRDAFFNATQLQKQQEATYKATRTQAMRQMVIDEATAKTADAQAAAHAAATARGVAEAHAQAAAEAAFSWYLNYTLARTQTINATTMIKIMHEAEREAVKAATKYMITITKVVTPYKGPPVDYSSVLPKVAAAAAAAGEAGAPAEAEAAPVTAQAATVPKAHNSVTKSQHSMSIPTLLQKAQEEGYEHP